MSDRPFVDQFIDDFFAESEQHLATVRRLLLHIESRRGGRPETSEIHELARSLHTLKGLSSMVGLASAEEVTHAMEDAVRLIRESRGMLDRDLIDVLFTGVKLLDRAIAAKRDGRTPPVESREYVAVVRQLVAARGPDLVSDMAESDWRVAGTALATVTPSLVTTTEPLTHVRRFEFAPSAEIAARGVGVETIRARLQTLGTIVHAAPRVRDGGGVVFEFVVATPSVANPDPSWAADGLSWGTVERQVPAPQPVAEVPAPGRDSSLAIGKLSQGANVVRVELARLDDLMRMVGEMVVIRSRLDEALNQANGQKTGTAWEDLREANSALERQLRSLRDGVMRIRLVPVGEVFERMRFALRDIARETGKALQLDVRGQETEIDKLVVDCMLEPLLHLVRNAASHGIESPAERIHHGKPADGRISLRARAAGDRIVLDVEDDGAGIDLIRVAERARALGLTIASTDGDGLLSSEALLDVLCESGFSTRETADMSSGRGVGMAVVRSAIRRIGGDLSVVSVPQRGTRFTIELPLTLMIADALLVHIGDQVMAVPQLVLREIVQLEPGAVTKLENNEVMSYRGGVLPLITLRDVFGLAEPADARPHVLVVGSDSQLAGLVVDRLVGLREIVIHAVTDPLVAMPGVAGATELADGRISLILDTSALVRRARDGASRRHAALTPAAATLARLEASA